MKRLEQYYSDKDQKELHEEFLSKDTYRMWVGVGEAPIPARKGNYPNLYEAVHVQVSDKYFELPEYVLQLLDQLKIDDMSELECIYIEKEALSGIIHNYETEEDTSFYELLLKSLLDFVSEDVNIIVTEDFERGEDY